MKAKVTISMNVSDKFVLDDVVRLLELQLSFMADNVYVTTETDES